VKYSAPCWRRETPVKPRKSKRRAKFGTRSTNAMDKAWKAKELKVKDERKGKGEGG
jgi:hypothetical protein